MPIGDRSGQTLAVATGIEADVLAIGLEADVVRLVHLIDGAPGAAWAPGGQPRVVFAFTIGDEKIVAIALIADPERIARIALTFLDD